MPTEESSPGGSPAAPAVEPPDSIAALVDALGMRPHPEGGWFAETWRSPTPDGGRAACTAIHYVLAAGERSHWHRVDADEVWCHHHGDPLRLLMSADGVTVTEVLLGGDPVGTGSTPHAVVPAGHWQAAEPAGAYALVSCVVAPGFEYHGFEMAPDDWAPGDEAPDDRAPGDGGKRA